MTCDDYQERLQAELDGEVPSCEDGVSEHAADCADCRQLQAVVIRMQRALQQRHASAVPAGLTSRVVSAVLFDRRHRQRRRRLVAGVFALAASVLIVVWVGAVWNRSSPGDRVSSHRQTTAPQPDPVTNMLVATQELSARTVAAMPKAPEIEPIQSTVSDATTAVTDLTSQTVDATMTRTKALLPSIDSTLFSTMDDASPLEPATTSLVETGQNVSAGFEPVANSAKRAFSLFRRDLPALPANPPGL